MHAAYKSINSALDNPPIHLCRGLGIPNISYCRTEAQKTVFGLWQKTPNFAFLVYFSGIYTAQSASYRCKISHIMSTTIASTQNICIKLQIAPVFAFFFRKELVDWQYLHTYTPIKAELLHETWVVRKLLSQYSEHKTRGIRQTRSYWHYFFCNSDQSHIFVALYSLR